MKTKMYSKPRPSAGVLVVKDGKFLLAQRNKENYNGIWIIPGGGVKFGESTKAAAMREFKEETNLDVDILSFIGFKEIINVEGNYHAIVFYYLATPKVGVLKTVADVDNAKFLSIEEIKTLNIADSVEWVLRESGFWV